MTRFNREFRTMTKNSHGYLGNRTRSSRHIVCIQYTLDIRHKVMLVSVYLIPNRGNFLSGWDWKHLFLPFNFVCARLHILPQLLVNCRLKVQYPHMRIPVSNKPSLTICVWASTSQKVYTANKGTWKTWLEFFTAPYTTCFPESRKKMFMQLWCR